LEPLPEDPELIDKDGLLVVRPRITGNIANWVQQDRDERIAQEKLLTFNVKHFKRVHPAIAHIVEEPS
jgi:hypothetical protein